MLSHWMQSGVWVRAMYDWALIDRARNVAATMRIWGADYMADTVTELIEALKNQEGTHD